jgi:hypothetical protein
MVILSPDFSFSLVDRHAEGFEVGDVGVFVIGDRGNHHPVARQVLRRDLLDPRQRLDFDGAELGEVDLRPGQQVETATERGCGSGGDRRGGGHDALDVGGDVFLEDAAFRSAGRDLAQIDAEFARQQAHRRAGVRPGAGGQAGTRRRSWHRGSGAEHWRGTGAPRPALPQRGGSGSWLDSRAAPGRPTRRRCRPRPLRRRRRRRLRRSFSPSATRISFTTPAADEGTSIVALSDSRVTSASSTLTTSPTMTQMSITGTSW